MPLFLSPLKMKILATTFFGLTLSYSVTAMETQGTGSESFPNKTQLKQKTQLNRILFFADLIKENPDIIIRETVVRRVEKDNIFSKHAQNSLFLNEGTFETRLKRCNKIICSIDKSLGLDYYKDKEGLRIQYKALGHLQQLAEENQEKLKYEGGESDDPDSLDIFMREVSENLAKYRGIDFLPREINPLEIYQTKLQRHKINIIPSSIGNLTNLTTLNLSGNKLKILPNEIGLLSNLNYLYLSDNELEDLPSSFGNLSKIYDLWIDKNIFSDLPECVWNMEVKDLRLSKNYLHKISPQIDKMTKLCHLDLSFNNISDIPLEFYKLKKLSTLNLKGNLELGEIISRKFRNGRRSNGTNYSYLSAFLEILENKHTEVERIALVMTFKDILPQNIILSTIQKILINLAKEEIYDFVYDYYAYCYQSDDTYIDDTEEL